jgi:hypothetical protein
MPSVLLQPASSDSAQKHFRDTIVSPVSLAAVREFLSPQEVEAFEQASPDGRVAIWGIAPSDDGQNERKFQRLKSGDVVFFGGRGRLIATGIVVAKFTNKPLARKLWSPGPLEPTWSQIFLLRDVLLRDVPKEIVNRAISHKANDAWQRANLLGENESAAALDLLEIEPGSEERVSEQDFRTSAIALMSGGTLDIAARVYARREQGFLRRSLFGSKQLAECALCGRTLSTELLVAAHIKRRADCSQRERLDFKNIVIPMCKLGCDALFEGHFITVGEGVVRRKRSLRDGDSAAAIVASLEGRSCSYWSESRRAYFDWHLRQ